MTRRRQTDHFASVLTQEDKVNAAFQDPRIAKPRGFDYYAVRWEDLQGPASTSGNAGGLSWDDCGDSKFKGWCFPSNTETTVYYEFQTFHAWKPGTECRAHIHFTPLANPAAAQGIVFGYRYQWTTVGVLTPKPTTWTAGTVTHTVNPGDVDIPVILPLFTTTPGAAYTESSILLVAILRSTAAAADTYTTSKGYGTATGANVHFHTVDVHVQLNKFGTASEYTDP